MIWLEQRKMRARVPQEYPYLSANTVTAPGLDHVSKG